MHSLNTTSETASETTTLASVKTLKKTGQNVIIYISMILAYSYNSIQREKKKKKTEKKTLHQKSSGADIYFLI